MDAIIFGLAISAGGLLWMWVSISRNASIGEFRAGCRHGSRPGARPVTRVGFFMLGLSWLLTGLAIAALDYPNQKRGTHA